MPPWRHCRCGGVPPSGYFTVHRGVLKPAPSAVAPLRPPALLVSLSCLPSTFVSTSRQRGKPQTLGVAGLFGWSGGRSLTLACGTLRIRYLSRATRTLPEAGATVGTTGTSRSKSNLGKGFCITRADACGRRRLQWIFSLSLTRLLNDPAPQCPLLYPVLRARNSALSFTRWNFNLSLAFSSLESCCTPGS